MKTIIPWKAAASGLKSRCITKEHKTTNMGLPARYKPSHHLFQRFIVGLCCLAALLPFPPVTASPQPYAQEVELKAIFFYNFLHFVYWPTPKERQNDANQLNITLLGSSPALSASLAALQKQLKETGKTDISIRQVAAFNNTLDLKTCDLLYISPAEMKNLQAILAKIGNAPILTVGDTAGFLEAGGMINMLVAENARVRWEINQTPLGRAGIKLSAKLLQIAVRVIGSPEVSKARTEEIQP